jgi:hypothetical protein
MHRNGAPKIDALQTKISSHKNPPVTKTHTTATSFVHALLHFFNLTYLCVTQNMTS